MSDLFTALHRILLPDRLIDPLDEFVENDNSSRCKSVRVRRREPRRKLIAARLTAGDHLPVLAQLGKAESVRRLPDFLVFLDPNSGNMVQVISCELKSSATGALSATPQVMQGIVIARYLLNLAAYASGESKLGKSVDIWPAGLIINPDLPRHLAPKPRTRSGAVPKAGRHQRGIRIHEMRDDREVWLEELFR